MLRLSGRRFALLLLILLPRCLGPERAGRFAGSLPWREMPPRAAYPHPRFVYRYSVIPGGVYSSAELEAAMRSDRIVAAHYAAFDRSHLEVLPAAPGRKVYVSYRLNDAVYWTMNAVALAPGELLLSDGKHQARTRCGNRISDTPQQPVSSQSLPEEKLDLPEEADQRSADALAGERAVEKSNIESNTAVAGAGSSPAGEPPWLVPDVFAPPAPAVQAGTAGISEPVTSVFGVPFLAVLATVPAEVVVKGTPPPIRLDPYGNFPVETTAKAIPVLFVLTMVPPTWSASANWVDPGSIPVSSAVVTTTVASADPGEVVLRLITPVPVGPWWWLTPHLPSDPGGSGTFTPGRGSSGTGQPTQPLTPLTPGIDGKPVSPADAQAVPEPSPVLLIAAALGILVWYARRRHLWGR